MQYWAISHYQKPRLPIKETIKIVWLISSANTDMHDVQYVEQKQSKKCYNNHRKTIIFVQ